MCVCYKIVSRRATKVVVALVVHDLNFSLGWHNENYGKEIYVHGLSPGWGHWVVFLGKTLNSHSASLHPGVQMVTDELLGKPNKLRGSDLQCTNIPSRRSRNTPSCFMLQKPG